MCRRTRAAVAPMLFSHLLLLMNGLFQVRGMAYRGSAEGMTYQHRNAKLATKSTGGKAVSFDGSLSGGAREKAIDEEMQRVSAPSADRAAGRGMIVSGKSSKRVLPKSNVPATAGTGTCTCTGPSRASRTAAQGGSAPSSSRPLHGRSAAPSQPSAPR